MFKRKRSAEDFAEEISSHLELEAEELRTQGFTPDEARRRARVEFGSVPAAKERFDLRNRVAWLDNTYRDFRFALHSLFKNPGFALTAILTIALGIGANTAVFSVMNAVLLKFLPVADPQNVVLLRTTKTPNRTGTIGLHQTFSYPVYSALREQHRAFSDVMAVGALSTDKTNVRVGSSPEQAEADMVSGNFFSGLGIQLVRGRGFTSDDEAGSTPVTVISYKYWTRRFGRDTGALGQTIWVKGIPFTIIGIAAQGFEGTDPGHSKDFWIPLQNRPEFNILGNPPENGKFYRTNPTWWCLNLIARIAPGVTPNQATSAVRSTFQNAAYIGLGAPMQGETLPVLSVQPARNFAGFDELYGTPLRILMAMVSLVLLIALTNVTTLLLARNANRQREFSVRMALGASRADFFRQLLMEAALLVATGSALAWVVASTSTRLLARWAQIESSLAPDRVVLLFSLGLLVLAVSLLTLVPMRLVMRRRTDLAFKTFAAASNTDTSISRVARAVVIMQIALCLVLLVGAGLVVRTLRNLQNLPLGMNTDGLIVFGLNPQSLHSQPQVLLFYQELQRRLRTLPGVEAVSIMQDRLGSGWSNNFKVAIDGRDPDVGKATPTLVRGNDIGPDFFSTLGVPLLQGREFTEADNANSPHVAIVSKYFVDTYLPNQNPLGHKVSGFIIVGVVADHKFRAIHEAPVPMAFRAYTQAPQEGSMNVEMRVRGNALAILPEVQKTVAADGSRSSADSADASACTV